MLTTRYAVRSDYPSIESLYERCGYLGGFSDTDEILLATSAGELVGVVRFCNEEGVTVLRGMQVHPDHRHRGVGRQLLDDCAIALGDRACFCLPYRHLISFYGRVGFRLLEADALPPFLEMRLRNYLRAGAAVVPMVRVPGVGLGAGHALESETGSSATR